MTEESKAVLYSTEGAVGRITLNRPEKKNALNDAVIAGIGEKLRAAGESAEIRVVLITGA